jgi:hypothetical protein
MMMSKDLFETDNPAQTKKACHRRTSIFLTWQTKSGFPSTYQHSRCADNETMVHI